MPRLARALVAGSLLWTALLFAAPLAVISSDRPVSRAGSLVYLAGAFVCHQRPERSFHLAGVPLPVCARCAALYVSALAGAVAAGVFATGSVAERGARWLLGLAAVPTVTTLAVELLGLAHPSNAARAISALPLGAAAAWVVIAMTRYGSVFTPRESA